MQLLCVEMPGMTVGIWSANMCLCTAHAALLKTFQKYPSILVQGSQLASVNGQVIVRLIIFLGHTNKWRLLSLLIYQHENPLKYRRH